jgi:hypothetical protein
MTQNKTVNILLQENYKKFLMSFHFKNVSGIFPLSVLDLRALAVKIVQILKSCNNMHVHALSVQLILKSLLLGTNQIAGITSDFKMDIIKHNIKFNKKIRY